MTQTSIARPASISRLPTRLLLSATLLSGLAGCAIIPGSNTYGMREQSSVQLPVKQGAEEVPANVRVKAITAELIIEQDKALKAKAAVAGGERKGAADSAQSAEQAMADYKLGPGDILTITVWDHPELTIPAGTYRSAEQSGTLVTEDGSIY